jgi:hypothetical protein
VNLAYLLFILLLDANGQAVERHLRLPASLAQCRQWEQQEALAMLAIRNRSALTLRTRCEAIATENL